MVEKENVKLKEEHKGDDIILEIDSSKKDLFEWMF